MEDYVFISTVISTTVISISSITLALSGCFKKKSSTATAAVGATAVDPAAGGAAADPAAPAGGKSQVKPPDAKSLTGATAPSGSTGTKPEEKKEEKPKTEEKKEDAKKDDEKKDEKKDEAAKPGKLAKSSNQSAKEKPKKEDSKKSVENKEEEDNGYEQCAEMTPEQLKKIAEATPK